MNNAQLQIFFLTINSLKVLIPNSQIFHWGKKYVYIVVLQTPSFLKPQKEVYFFLGHTVVEIVDSDLVSLNYLVISLDLE